MESEIFTLCDYAQDMNGKLTIVGTFDSIGAINFPCKHPHCSITARLRFAESEFGTHKGVITFKDSKGSDVMPKIGFDLEVKKSNSLGYATVNFVINIGNLEFKEPGKFIIELFIDEQWEAGLTLSTYQVRRAA